MLREKTLVLHCMPFMEKGVGSAWGLPVIISGKERLSALSLSEKLEAPGLISFGADPFREEHFEEMEALGIGPLGRYLGGEPVKPLRLGAVDFFCTQNKSYRPVEKTEKRCSATAAELFCTGLEFDNTHWIAESSPKELFTAHLEFLRTWGFSGGIAVDETALAPLLSDYICHLQKETEREKAKTIVLAAKQFFEMYLKPQLPFAKISADAAKGEIPVNFGAGNISVLSQEMSGLGIALYEDIVPLLRSQKVRCDVLITVNSGFPKNQRNESFYSQEITARLKLAVSTFPPLKPKQRNGKQQDKTETKKDLNSYLFRSCTGAALPFPFSRKTECGIMIDWKPELKREHCKQFHKPEKIIDREEAALLELLPQWEAGRIVKTGGCVFAINTKFSGLRAADFKEEQALFLSHNNQSGAVKLRKNWDAPPVRHGMTFTGLNQAQLEFFLQWRSECRRGYIRIKPDSMYIETYIALYAEELTLCMGKESPLQHFTALMNLFNACAVHYPETALRLCRYCVDFAVLYGIEADAFPIFLKELLDNGWFNKTDSEIAGIKDMLVDLAVCHFLIEETAGITAEKYWPVIKNLIPPGALARKENTANLSSMFCRTLCILDMQLRQDWNKPFFALFFPQQLQKFNFTAFENSRFMGDSSYTVYRPAFSSHKPLLGILTALALEPEKNPLPAVKTRLNPLSLENELLIELRKESDEVRDMLKHDEELFGGHESNGAQIHRAGFKKQRTIGYIKNKPDSSELNGKYQKPDKKTFMEFIVSLDETEQSAIKNIRYPAHNSNHFAVSDTVIDAVNSAFYKQFGDLLIETSPNEPSINEEYQAILDEWE